MGRYLEASRGEPTAVPMTSDPCDVAETICVIATVNNGSLIKHLP